MKAGYLAAAARIDVEIRLPETGLVLDIGCNNGAGMEALQKHWPGMCIMGIEPDERRASIARSRIQWVFTASAEDMPVNDASIDLVFSRHSLEHVPNVEKAIAEFYRVLVPGGHLYVQAPIEPGGSPNKLHVSHFESFDELRKALRIFEKEIYLGPQETVGEVIVQKVPR